MTDSVYNSSSETLNQVNSKASELARLDQQSDKGYAHLGLLLLQVCELQYWRLRFETFRKYLESVAVVSKKSTAQLHQYFLAVRDLSDTFTTEELERMGISKALKLRTAKDYALVLPAILKVAALDPDVTCKELKQLISKTLNMPESEGDDWMELDGFIVTPEERALIEQAMDVARHTEPLTKATISESAQLLDVMKKFAMEFLAGHSGDGN